MGVPLKPDDKRLQQFRKLTEVSRALTYAVSLEEVLRLTAERAAELLDTSKAVLMLSNDEGLLSVRASFGLNPETTRRFSEPLNETLIYRLQGLLNTTADHFLGVPLVVSGQVTGILAVALPDSSEAGVGTEENEWLLSALADQAAVALEKTRLDERGKFRELLLGIVSHDLRNPIGAILLGTHTLLRREELDERTIKMIVRIQSSAERAHRLIRDLLDYTQAHLGGGIRIEAKPMDLHTVVRQVVEEMAISHPDRTIHLVHNEEARGEWDSDRLSQLLTNLVANAVHYGRPETPVQLEVRSDEQVVELLIHNEGVPIPGDRLAHIFEPMQQLKPEMTKDLRSVGLGLYIVKSIVNAHNGTVGVVSTESEGTTFKVRLPRRSSSALPLS